MIISIINQKGGVGKTTLTCNLSSVLSYINKRILVVDIDPQAHSCFSLGLTQPFTGASDSILHKKIPLKRIRVKSNLDVITPGYSMFEVETSKKLKPDALIEALTPIKGEYDFIFIDCPPSSGSIVVQALKAADSIIIPTTPDPLSIRGLDTMLSTVSKWEEHLSRRFNAAVIMTKFQTRNPAHREAFSTLKTKLSSDLFSETFNHSSLIATLPVKGKTLIDTTRQSKKITNLTKIAKEFMEKYK